MCGIAGIALKNGQKPNEDLLKRMSASLAHRGPDGEGVYAAQGIGLAHRRLSIIDVSARATQPMRKDSLAIVFNGEIYNYRDLRAELKADWKTESDTEAVLEGYRVWGDEVANKLRGMFAFAIWDDNKKRLFMARDRIGKKPLFYTEKNGDLFFASEVKAFHGLVGLKPDWQAVRLFLGLQYVPSPRTGFDKIFQLQPGTIGIWEQGELAISKYQNSNFKDQTDEADYSEEIRNRLKEAVKVRQLASDVPVGAFLSGGIDSASVVAYAVKHSNGKLQTFTMGFADEEMDERREARGLAKHFGTDHHEFEASPEDLLGLAEKIVEHYDVPFADSSALPLWLLARETAKKVKVVLTGDGGDEVFGGYRRYVAYERALSTPGFLSPLINLAGRALNDARFSRMAEAVKTKSYGEMFCGSYFGTRDLNKLCTPEFLHETRSADAVEFVSAHSLREALHFDLASYLPDDLNVKMDRATMAFGLEARAPFLDQNLVSFADRLPLNQKVDHGKTKIALRRALKGVVPEAVLERKKRGFQVPLASWFRGPLLGLIRERCLGASNPLRKIMNESAIQNLIEENKRGLDHGNRLWMLFSLSTWLSKHDT